MIDPPCGAEIPFEEIERLSEDRQTERILDTTYDVIDGWEEDKIGDSKVSVPSLCCRDRTDCDEITEGVLITRNTDDVGERIDQINPTPSGLRSDDNENP